MRIFANKKGLKILFVSTEAAPFAKVGGLGSVMYSLPKALSEMNHDVRVLIPKYLSIEEKFHDLKLELRDLRVPTGNENGPDELICNVKSCLPNAENGVGVMTYLLENQEYYEQRANVYGYADDPIRWALLSRGAVEFMRVNSEWTPDIIVCADWQTGLIPNYLKTTYKNHPTLSKIPCLYSIHNLSYQGSTDHKFVSEMDYDDGHSEIPSFFSDRLNKLNWMRRGIMYADAINTVSENYAKEIMTKDYGEMLDDLLREKKAVISGILNGIDYNVWNTTSNPNISFPYSDKTLDERLKNKKILQERFNLPVDNNVFLISYVGRLTQQKGLSLLSTIIEIVLNEIPMQFIIVGEGESDLMTFFHELEAKYPKQVAVHLKYDSILPHIVFAGADLALIPSKFEPCGLIQMEAMRMGTIPLVRKTGGLADSVEDYDPGKSTGTGFSFEKFDSYSLMIALVRAYENFKDKPKWNKLQRRVMLKDFSWNRSAKKYTDLFTRMINKKKSS